MNLMMQNQLSMVRYVRGGAKSLQCFFFLHLYVSKGAREGGVRIWQDGKNTGQQGVWLHCFT